ASRDGAGCRGGRAARASDRRSPRRAGGPTTATRRGTPATETAGRRGDPRAAGDHPHDAHGAGSPRMTDTANYTEQLEQLRQLQMLTALSQRVASPDSLESVIDTLLQAAIQEIGADRGSLLLHDGDAGELYTYVSTGIGSRQIRLLDDLRIAGAGFHHGARRILPAPHSAPP